MDIAFVMGVIAGFLIGVGFSLFFSHIVTKRILAVLKAAYEKKTKKHEEEEEPSDWWKGEGYDPRDRD